jgi:hypothetical protein
LGDGAPGGTEVLVGRTLFADFMEFLPLVKYEA